ncbi:hypothetical protein GF319_07470 [Candidatus Bathyarchaeota archaeon]|jgi:hypothetical protein|nr:hypothetical protein [Candidatus Bathyarchaeota archaeon]
MAPKWYEYAKKNLKPGEEIDKNYEGRLDGNFGYLFITDKRLLFIKQEGFLRKSYEIILDMPKNNLDKIERTGNYQMEIILKDGEIHSFESDIGISVIEKSMEEAISVD